MNDTCAGATSTHLLDVALTAAFELANDDHAVDVLTAAAVACDVDLDALWDHLDAGIGDLWPLAAGVAGAPPRLVARWLASSDPVVVAAAARHQPVPSTQLEVVIDTWAAAGNTLPVRSAAANPCLAGEVLARLAVEFGDDVARAVAANPSTPHDTLLELGGPGDSGILGAIAQNPGAPVAAFEALAGCHSHWVRFALARNPAVPSHVLERLADGGTNYASVAADEALIERRSRAAT